MHPTVKAELKSFVRYINKDTGITNSFDYNSCVDMFSRLREEGVGIDPDQVQRWLIDNGGLQPRDAKSVRAMAAKFAAGRRVRHR